jgi:hypothetical protein
VKNKYETRGDITIIFCESPKYGVKEIVIDTADFELVDAIPNSWRVRKDSKSLAFYAACHVYDSNGKDKGVLLHRLIMNPDKGMVVDHIDRDTLNNSRKNLRVVTRAQNRQNLKAFKRSTTGIRGVYWEKVMNKWAATVTVDGRKRRLGYFENIDDAEKAVVEARKSLMPYSYESA